MQVQNDMQKAMGGALVAILEKLLAKFLNNLLPCLTKHLNQYPMKEASTNLHKGVESNIHPLVIMLMDNLLHDYYNIFSWRQLFGCCTSNVESSRLVEELQGINM
nr:uncharacterized protein LOC109177640 [Ipomoea batatas]